MRIAVRDRARSPRRKLRTANALIAATTLLIAGMLVAAALQRAAAETSDPVAIAVPDFEYVDTSGELRDQRQEHETRLRRFSEALRQDLTRSGRYRIVAAECGSAPCTTAGTQPPELLTQARQAGARLLLIGGIHKESTLLEWAKLQVVDLQGNRVVLEKLLTFRGDTDQAWDRAEAFAARELTSQPLEESSHGNPAASR
jgi:hypothetical protein